MMMPIELVIDDECGTKFAVDKADVFFVKSRPNGGATVLLRQIVDGMPQRIDVVNSYDEVMEAING